MIIAIIGKGGVGKTTVTSLVLKRLLESGQTPLLAIDADPSNCLGSALGIAVQKTLGDFRETMRDSPDRPPSMSNAEWLALRAEDAMVEKSGFDLLTMGRPEGKGCYCFVNNLIRDHLDRLARSYRHVVMDCEAGLEHLSRRTAGKPDLLICVTNRSRMSAETIRRSLILFESIHGGPPARADLVLNQFDQNEPLATEMAALAAGEGPCPFSRVITIPRDFQVASFESSGQSLLELKPATVAMTALSTWEVGK